MKRLLATLLTLVILLSVVPSVGTVAKAASPDSPFYALTWDPASVDTFGNIAQAPVIQVKNIGGNITLGGSEPAALAKSVKTKLDKLPDGMKYIRLFNTGVALELGAKYVIYVGEGIVQLRTQFEAFIEEFYKIGGELDGVILDTEYIHMGSWYIYTEQYGGHYKPSDEKIQANGYNRNVYHDIVAHPKYQTELRPMLEEYGFTFYEEVGGDRSEIWSMYPPQTIKQVLKGDALKNHNAKYGDCYSIWNRVMYDRQAMYFNYALYEPMAARYPDADMSDYQAYEGQSWYKNLYTYTNGMKVGNTSNNNDYSHRPSSSYFVEDGTYLYQNPTSYNEAVYDDDPYGMLLYNINLFKNIYDATDTKKVSVWISRYDYSKRAGSYSGNTAYYTESLYHYGMLDPQPFLVYMTVSEGGGQAGYDERLRYMSEALSELTRVAGYSDRQPISIPANWNDGYLLSGMYAGGRNIWRITPDTTDGTTLEAFKIKDSDPAFRINGTTVTFPGGRIIEDTAVTLGSVGYWVETSKDTMPVVTRDADRYEKNPSYEEDFTYADGTAFNGETAKEKQAWQTTGTVTVQGGALALTGTASLQNVKLPKNITAGDSYAKQQAWEISVTLPKAMNSGAKAILLNTSADGGFKIEGGKVYYDESGSYQELGVSLTAGQKYTFKRDIDFQAFTCTYSVFAGDKLVKQVSDVEMKTVELPVETIYMSCSGLTTQVLLDDYKLYPTGVAQDLSVYDANGGEKLDADEKNAKTHIAYRLSWMNATAEQKNVLVKAAYYDSNDKLISEAVLGTVTMKPGDDGVAYGVAQNQSAKMKIYLQDAEEVPETKPTVPTVKPTESTKKPTVPAIQPTESTEQPTEATKKPATTATEPSAEPTKAPTKATNGKTPTRLTIGNNPTKATTAVKPSENTATQETLAPEETLAPGETSAPQETLAPGETLATEETLAPGETLAPEETMAPGETLAPTEATQAPTEATEATEATTPVDTDKADDGGSKVWLIVVIAAAVLAAAGAAVYFFVIKKKAK